MSDELDKRKKRLLTFQKHLIAFGQRQYDVLDYDGFADDLSIYILRLYQLHHFEVLMRVLERVRDCVVKHKNGDIRMQALLVLSNTVGRVKEKEWELC